MLYISSAPTFNLFSEGKKGDRVWQHMGRNSCRKNYNSDLRSNFPYIELADVP